MATIPASGGHVFIWRGNVLVAESVCDSNGNYSFAVPDGTYTVWTEDYPCACDEIARCGEVCTHFGYAYGSSPEGGTATEITVSNGESRTDINFLLPPVDPNVDYAWE